ncbi:YfcC family protein [Borrelia anserina]|uniref:Arginine/ornithine antiporter n=2 Tax=Borrelia anserina TaxID=143 RepID=W5SQ92_BORAN|nr:YfcC family protein [Borrelia anserina]AHH08818.1 Arginine/ornithine antiporter [Borrelia anserina BA2]APR65258.1 arginine:ornithine antiporter [Borrelia anserina Es]UPA07186.1 YfcC family protein [Borrelia anserina]
MVNKNKMPSSFTIIFALIVIMTVLTYIVPAGEFYKEMRDINGNLREVVVAGTYHTVERTSQGFLGGIVTILTAMAKGMEHAVEVIVFILIVGGAYGVILGTGAVDAGIAAAIKKMGNKDRLFIPFMMFIFSIGGTITGMYEETLPFYLIMIPLVIALGYDNIVAVSIIGLGAGVGTMASTINPFATGIAAAIAGIGIKEGFYFRIILYLISVFVAIVYVLIYAIRVKDNPKKSIVYEQREEHYDLFVKGNRGGKGDSMPEFTNRRKMVLMLYAVMIVFLIYSILELGWWMKEMTMLYLGTAILSAFICKMSELQMWEMFVEGSKDMITAALIIGMARGVMIVADEGMITGTILNAASEFLYGVPKAMFIVLNELVQICIGFIVPSSSGHASLTMSMMAPLADFLDMPRSSVVLSMQTASGLVNLLTPTSGVIMAVLSIAKISYGSWFKFVMPLFVIEFLICILMVMANVYL